MSVRVVFIGDVHGSTNWKVPVADALSKGFNVVFLGDYLDSFNVKPYEIFENLKDIIEYKKKYPTRITLLLGNHDYAYMHGQTGISGFNGLMWVDYREVLSKNWDLFDLAWGYQGKNKYTLATHAGLCKWYYDSLVNDMGKKNSVMHQLLVTNATKPWTEYPIHELLNFFKDQASLVWTVGRPRGGISPYGGLLWADKSELLSNAYPGIDQVVGHTPCKYIEMRIKGNNKLYFVDIDAYEKNEYAGSLMLELE